MFLSIASKAQDSDLRVSGTLIDASDRSGLVAASVQLINIKDTTQSRFTVTDGDGQFYIDQLPRAFYKLKVRSLGYVTYTKVFRLTQPDTQLGALSIQPDVTVLEEITVGAEVVAVQQLGDTTQYNAQAFKVNPDASATDLVSKMPGIVVDDSGVSANGESIEQVLMDGKRFFGQDPLLSLNTIPADVVDKVQVYDEESDQSQFTGFDDGNTTKTMNVVTKKDKRNGQFGKAYAGIGENELYKAGTTINSFNKDQRLTFLGMTNNINQQNFGSEDLAGISGGGRRGGFRRGGNQNFITGTQDGITKTNALGVNFTDDWGKNTSFEGSYFFNQSNNGNDQVLNRESLLNGGSQFYTEEQLSNSDNQNHRLNLRIRHKINDKNNLLIRSSISYQNNEGDDTTIGETTNETNQVLNQTFNRYTSLNRAFNISNRVILQHRFSKIGRTLSIDLNSRINPTLRENLYQDLERDSLIDYNTDESQYTLGSTVTYTEPVGTTAQLSMSYAVSHTASESDRQTFVLRESEGTSLFSEALSNTFKSGYTKNTPTVMFSNNNFGNHFNAGLSFQHAALDNQQLLPTSDQFTRSFSTLLPVISARFDLGESGNFLARYTTSTTEPSVSQLQNVIDNSDPLFLTVGNPNLNQTYSHALVMRMQKHLVDKNITFSNLTRVTASSNYIGSGTTIISADSITNQGLSLVRGAQLTTPINVDGYWFLRNNTTFGVLLAPIKNNLNISAGLSYQRLPGLTNNRMNIASTYGLNLRLGLVSNISEKVDYNLSYQIDGSRVQNSIQSETNNQYFTQTLGVKLNFIFPKGLVFRNETYFQKYTGLNDAFDTSYTLWSMGVAKKFLKDDRGELELSVFDLLGQNQSFDQTVTAQYVQESQTQVLQRYFMLTFSYQIRRFK